MKQILFTKVNTAELVEKTLREPGEHEVLIRNLYTAVSAGTEYSNVTGDPSVSGSNDKGVATFPRALGYCGVCVIEKIGEKVTSVKVGDTAVVWFGMHADYNVVNESQVYKFENIDPLELVFSIIAAFPMLAIHRTKLEIGEPAMVVGLGILGLLGVQLCKAAGAYPVIAVDIDENRRKLAADMGADYVLDSSDENFKDTVLGLTDGKGVPVVIEVTGVGNALKQALSCTARMGRVALLGCTRRPVDDFDFYHLVHAKGISLIGANNTARADSESHHGIWTMRDDTVAVINLTKGGRINQKCLINEIHSPKDAPEVYHRLATDYKNFPIGVVFDWSQV